MTVEQREDENSVGMEYTKVTDSMTDEELAEKTVMSHSEKAIREQIPYFKFAEQMFLAGLKAGRPEWHKVADGDLPNCEHGHTVFNQDLDRVIMRNGKFEYLDGALANVIAWCEKHTFTVKE